MSELASAMLKWYCNSSQLEELIIEEVILLTQNLICVNYIVGPLPFLNPTLPPSSSMRLITSSNRIGV